MIYFETKNSEFMFILSSPGIHKRKIWQVRNGLPYVLGEVNALKHDEEKKPWEVTNIHRI